MSYVERFVRGNEGKDKKVRSPLVLECVIAFIRFHGICDCILVFWLGVRSLLMGLRSAIALPAIGSIGKFR
ncbi:MAG: hypothetical protein VKN72_02665 [Nostocales cyanobacterium 94392]|nr:hypothetical protein [Nostocales cyanobacterium 94392]